jgi:inward rectifier potassium channel
MKSKRFHNRSLKVRRLGAEQSPWEDVYHRLMRLSWPRFLVQMLFIYLLIAAIFAVAYDLVPGSIANITDNDLFKYFAFSVQTLSTVGYGYFYPATSYAHVVVITQTTIGLFFTAALTGLFFAKFSRPQARVVFSDKILWMTQNGQPVLCLRLGNFRTNRVFEGRARFALLRDEISKEGERLRRIVDLKLLRTETPLFVLSWTLLHPIDANSPFAGMSVEELNKSDWDFTCTFIGLDEDMESNIVAHNTYSAQDVVRARKFKDMITTDGKVRVIDFSLLHEIEYT